jgi:hypothetical protein
MQARYTERAMLAPLQEWLATAHCGILEAGLRPFSLLFRLSLLDSGITSLIVRECRSADGFVGSTIEPEIR